jgi:hypothetical protein
MSMRYQAGIMTASYFPLKVPNRPTGATATMASSTSVSVAFTAPTDVGAGAITGYTVVSSGGQIATGASSPVTVTGLTTGVAYTFVVYANNAFGNSPPSAPSNSVTPVVQGQQEFTTAGTFSWIAPAGATSVSVVTVGGGGGGGTPVWPGGGNSGGGGGLGYKNNYTVVPGNSYTVVVGAGGTTPASTYGGTGNGGNGSESYFINASIVRGGGGTGGDAGSVVGVGGSYTGDGGGTGGTAGTRQSGFSGSSGAGGSGGAGGAGGYSGNGGNGGNASSTSTGSGSNGTAGSGGGGGGGGGAGWFHFADGRYAGSVINGGGGVSLLGQGVNGTAGLGQTNTEYPDYGTTFSGGGGVGGTGTGYGGGGSGGASGAAFSGSGASPGGGGAVRIIWPGTTRQFPSTNTGNV